MIKYTPAMIVEEFKRIRALFNVDIARLADINLKTVSGRTYFGTFMEEVRALAAEQGLHVINVVEFPGWWAAFPTDNVYTRALLVRCRSISTEFSNYFSQSRGLQMANSLSLSVASFIDSIGRISLKELPSQEEYDECLGFIETLIAERRSS